MPISRAVKKYASESPKANPRIDWIIRSHGLAHTYRDEGEVNESLSNLIDEKLDTDVGSGAVILFDTAFEALGHYKKLI